MKYAINKLYSRILSAYVVPKFLSKTFKSKMQTLSSTQSLNSISKKASTL